MKAYNGENHLVWELEHDPCSPVNRIEQEVFIEIKVWLINSDTGERRNIEIKDTVYVWACKGESLIDKIGEEVNGALDSFLLERGYNLMDWDWMLEGYTWRVIK